MSRPGPTWIEALRGAVVALKEALEAEQAQLRQKIEALERLQPTEGSGGPGHD